MHTFTNVFLNYWALIIKCYWKPAHEYLTRTDVHISVLIQTRQLFHLEEAILQIVLSIDSCFSNTLKFWSLFCFGLTDGLEWCGLLVDYCDVFISCLDSHSDGTHSLQRIHWWTRRNATFLQICSDEETNSDGLSVTTFSPNFNFWVN